MNVNRFVRLAVWMAVLVMVLGACVPAAGPLLLTNAGKQIVMDDQLRELASAVPVWQQPQAVLDSLGEKSFAGGGFEMPFADLGEPSHGSVTTVVYGGINWSPTGPFEAIGSIGGCTATLVSDYAALTAAHCAENGTTRTFTLPNGRGSISGKVVHHPLYGVLKWHSYDYAVVRFPQSIFEDTSVNTSGMRPLPVSTETLEEGAAVLLYGYGGTGQKGCQSGGGGLARWALAEVESIDEDWHYKVADDTVGLCPGDSGGPMLAYDEGWYVVGINSWVGGHPDSFAKSTYVASDWIRQNSGDPDAPGDTWGKCVYYPDRVGGAWLSTDGNQSSFEPPYNNSVSTVWVKKGYKVTLYDSSGYAGELASMDGFNGDNCNEFGCLHDLAGTGANDRASSAKCENAIPQDTWGHCVLYDSYGNGRYYSWQGENAAFKDEDAFWNNRASQVWVKKGYAAVLFPSPGYRDNGGNHQTSVTLSGSAGDWCNSHGCLHDLAGTQAEHAASSVRCRSD